MLIWFIYLIPLTCLKWFFKDILLTHEYCREYEERIAPHHNDPLHDILEDFGQIPSAEQLLGIDDINPDKNAKEHSLILTLHPQPNLSSGDFSFIT